MRLIDADKLKEYINEKSDYLLCEWDTAGVLNAIEMQETVFIERQTEQEGKKPMHWTDDYKDYFFCPNCQKDYKYNCGLNDGLKYKQCYCEKCGQAIDWK